jgi:hypothetical protein
LDFVSDSNFFETKLTKGEFMKYVTFLFALALIGFATLANASEQKSFNFNYNNFNVYYACDYARDQAANTLEVLGAENVSVNCTGGIENNTMLPISMNGTFNLVEKGARTVVLKGRDSCDFNVKLINTLLSTIDHETVMEHINCMDAQGSYHFEINLK